MFGYGRLKAEVCLLSYVVVQNAGAFIDLSSST